MRSLSDLSAPVWTPKLVRQVESASAAIARLDTRFSCSPVAAAWSLRASWTGWATAMQGQGVEIEEIDIFARSCGVPIPGRVLGPTSSESPDALPHWQSELRDRRLYRWRDDSRFSNESADDWRDRPTLLQALEVLARHARSDPTSAPWLGLPKLLQGMGITKHPLPCLVTADKAIRLKPRDGENITARFLRGIISAAETGLERIVELERQRAASIEAICTVRRPGQLKPLLARILFQPVISPSTAAAAFKISVSGAGKLLSRAADAGLLSEISGRQAWRVYISMDLAIAFGFVRRPTGRPVSPAPLTDALDPALAQFDAEMAELDRMLSRLGVTLRTADPGS